MIRQAIRYAGSGISAGGGRLRVLGQVRTEDSREGGQGMLIQIRCWQYPAVDATAVFSAARG